jgi:predicted transcriptional regulator
MNDLTRYKLCAGLHVPAAAKLLYCYLLDMSGGRHSSVVISVKKLAKDVGLSRSATSRNLHHLKHLDMIGIVPRYSEDGGRLSNQYILK